MVNESEKNLNTAAGTTSSEEIKDLLYRSADGDLEAYGRFYQIKRPKMYRIAARICGPDEAEDVVQAVFLRLWKVLPAIDRLHKIDGWLHRATVNKCIDVLRHVHQRIKLVLVDELDKQGVELRTQFQQGEITKVFDRLAEFLSPRQRTAFVLCEMEGYSSREAGDYMGVKGSTVRNMVMQAKTVLRQAIQDHFPEYLPASEKTDT